MQYEIDAIANEAGWFKGAHEKMGEEFKEISEKRVKDGKAILTTLVWEKE